MNLVATEVSVVFAVAGAVIGSFTATSVVRGLRGQQATIGRSACDHCGATLAYGETAPLVSFIARKGACRTCGGPIDPLHLAGEVAGAIVGLCVGLVLTRATVGPFAAAILMALGFSLLALSLVDFRTQRIPDVLIGVVFLACILLAATGGTSRLMLNLLWAAGCFTTLSVVRRLFAKLRGEDGLGFGDVKLLSALALWLGPLTPYALILACLFALSARLVAGQIGGREAFGPWIALGAWTTGILAEVGLWPV